MILFVDAAALVKLYVAEAGSGAVRRRVRDAAAVYACEIVYVEVAAVLEQAGRSGLLQVRQATAARSAFERDWQSVNAVLADPAMIRRGADIAGGTALGASAALSLAASEAMRRLLPAPLTFMLCAGDPACRAEALRIGIPLADIGSHPEPAAS